MQRPHEAPLEPADPGLPEDAPGTPGARRDPATPGSSPTEPVPSGDWGGSPPWSLSPTPSGGPPAPRGWRPPGPARARRALGGLAALVVVAVVAVAAFAAGVGYDRAGLVPAVAPLDTAPPADVRDKIGLLYEAWNLVEQHYVDRTALDPTQLTYGAIRGMVEALGDTGHTDFLTPQEAANLSSDLSGQYQGIGVELSIKKEGPAIVAVFDGSPAQKAGLRTGDLILAVNGRDVTGDSFDQLASQLRGPAGTTVRVTVLDPGSTTSREVTVTRAAISVPNVTWAMVPGSHVADVRLAQFAQNAASQLAAALRAARTAGATSIVLDLRGDPGGYVSEAVGTASQFLPAGRVVFVQRDASGKETSSTTQAGGTATTLPLVVLVDDGTASAAEIVAGALQDSGRARIVGVKTFGTGTVLQTFSLSDGSQVRIGVAEWLTPKGHQIWHNGIQPDVTVTLPASGVPLTPSDLSHTTAAGLASSGDTQLLRALQLLAGS